MNSTLREPSRPNVQPQLWRSRILIVDDDALAAEALAAALTAQGHVVRWVGTTWEALGQAAPFAPEVVVYDPFPRTTSVPRFAQKLRAICASAGHPRPLVYAASPEAAPEGYTAREGVDAYLPTPQAIEAVLTTAAAPRS